VKRREFLALLGAALYSCSSEKSPTGNQEELDAVFSGGSSDISAVVADQFDRVYSLAQNPGSEAIFGLEDTSGDMQTLRLSMSSVGPASYLHPVMRVGSKTAHMVFGWGTLAPTVKLVDSSGNELASASKIPSGFMETVAKESGLIIKERANMDLDSFLVYGISLAAGALAIWLGAKILGMVVAAAAFVAFNALLIGVVLAAVGALEPAVRWVLDQLNISTDDVESFFNKGVGWISELIRFIGDGIQQGYST